MKTVSVKLPAPLAIWLSQQAKELHFSKSDIIRQALEQHRQVTDKNNCLTLLQDLCGSIKGPRDLSTNPKYMEGFRQ